MSISFSEVFGLSKAGWGIASAVWRWLWRNKRKLTPQDRLALRSKWKPQFEKYVSEMRHDKRLDDLIIRDMRRIDIYPENSTGHGISAWFKGELVGTYEKGFMIGFSWEEVVEYREGWRVVDYMANEAGTAKYLRTGFIPYDNIESVDWDGDRYYGCPHIYCYFDIREMPYDRMGLTDPRNRNGYEYFVEVAGPLFRPERGYWNRLRRAFSRIT